MVPSDGWVDLSFLRLRQVSNSFLMESFDRVRNAWVFKLHGFSKIVIDFEKNNFTSLMMKSLK